MSSSVRFAMFYAALGLPLVCASHLRAQTPHHAPGELAWSIHSEPRTLDPARVDDRASAVVRYLTGGVLVRINRVTQQPMPDLAESWNVSRDGRVVTFHLRPGLQFSDGSPLTARDVTATLERNLAAGTQAPVAQEFLAPAQVQVQSPDPRTVVVHLPERVVGIERVFDEIAIEPAKGTSEARITSGPYFVDDYRRGAYLHLRRNDHFFERGAGGERLPIASGIRLDILNNREAEVQNFLRGEYDLIDPLVPDYFSVIARREPGAERDLGASLNTEQMWFNQNPAAPLPQYEKSWYASRAFRVAVSQAIHRADLARIAYDGHATPAYGFISPANRTWYNTSLHTEPEDVHAAERLLASDGFHRNGSQLVDREGHPVRFSILTNSGNAPRAKMAALIQQDLAALGMQVNIVTLDFPALIERLMTKSDYQAALLGLSNVETDPNTMMNTWLSSSSNHQWNPGEKSPATPWEAEIDRLMKQQAGAPTFAQRKRAVDRVQQIVADEQPFVYLVYPNALDAISPKLGGVQPAIAFPGVVWNVQTIRPAGVSRP